MKPKHFRITSKGKVVQVSDRIHSHVTAKNITDATVKLLDFARRALDETPVIQARNGATQHAYWMMGCEGVPIVHVQAGYGDRTDLCMSGAPSMDRVDGSTASFAYYEQLSREQAA